jgi:G3E family GTPase
MTFVDAKFRDRIRLDSVTCVVDADQLFANFDEYPGLTMLKLRQIGFSDMVILNKVDLAGPEQVEKVKDWINNQMNRVRIVEAAYCDVPLEILLAVGRFDPAQLSISESGDNHKHDHEHDEESEHAFEAGQAFKTWSYESERPFSLKALEEMVKKRLPGAIYRCKGIVYAEEVPDRRAVLQVVGRRADVELLDEWNGRQPRTRIVAIGAPEDMDEHVLNERFDSCLI